MNKKIKIIGFFLALMIIIIMSIFFLRHSDKEKIEGSISIAVNDDMYEYMQDVADKFMLQNQGTNIKIDKISDTASLEDIIKDNTLNYTMVQINDTKLNKIYENVNIYSADENEYIKPYKSNFSKYRLQKEENQNIIKIPLTSRPLALFINESLLSKYGYTQSDINKWDDIIKIGQEVYQKSEGKVKLLSGTGQNYNDLLDLLLMEYVYTYNDNLDEDQIKILLDTKFNELKDSNVLTWNKNDKYIARIGSINAVKEISKLEDSENYVAIKVPTLNVGENKNFASEGSNLLLLNNSNNKLIEKFTTFLVTDNSIAVDYIKKGEFFSSFQSCYKSKEIEEKVNNFNGQSPFLLLANVEEKTPEFNSYKKYISIRNKNYQK
ncbi:carbohydrate ABC transporter substrate-binding protein [Clostridium sp. BJN0001]|uniref:carbohydrate ABC transporter substrate-binding protein n=1 Tax=Clostridium sp. BJN0001 TaxID=2930219 RepID=UPI001FD1E0C7|nr:carbohydrate ABC transporter substrate-binding protein [Clostridium sp. BJN0001]